MKAILPSNEAQRLKALHSYEILDTESGPEFDDITLLASQICGTSIAMISLVDEHRQWFKSKIGITNSETSRDIAFCAHGILQAEVMIVEDTLRDTRFASNPLVTSGPKIRFYAGAPLISPDGHALGMLCVNDQAPRTLSAGQKTTLEALSRQVVVQLELRRSIAQMKEKDEELRTSEERFRELAENVTDAFWTASPDLSVILYINSAYERIWGRSVASLYADPLQWSNAVLPEDRDGAIAALGSLSENQTSVSFEYRIARPDGSIRWIHSRGFQVRDVSGKVVRITGIAQDITERKRNEEALRLLGSAVEQSKESIVITEADLDLPGPRIVFVNPAFTKLYGYTAQEAIGKTPRILQGAKTDRSVLARLRKNLESGETFEGEAVNYRKDGTEFNLEWQIAPIRDASRKTTHFVAIQRDITARKRLESQLFQSQKMETVGKLAGGIAHEFNSIMTAIIGQSELLLGDLPSNSPLAKNVTEIRKAADRAAILTRQLLAYGRKQILQPELLDLNAVLVGMEKVIRHLMGRDVDVRIVPNTGLKSVKVDAGQMEQVIINILMNAVDAMPNGGKLTLESANVTLDQDYVSRFSGLKAGEYVMVAITDTGAGMSEEVKARIFEPFFSTKGVGQGAGLGLSSCYGILKQSGGHINVYSEIGRGATFKFYLPQVEHEREIQPQPARSAELPRGIETILLVEDDPALREMAGTLLGRLGYTVLIAANGLEALTMTQQAGRGHIDLLFTDVVMPQMSGKELSDRIRSLYPQTKILFTSAYTESAIVHQGVLNEGVALLQKPFTPSAMAARVRETLDEKSREAKHNHPSANLV